MRRLSSLLLVLVVTSLSAQSKPESSGIKLGSLDLSGSIRLRAEGLGLVRRAQDERQICLRGVYAAIVLSGRDGKQLIGVLKSSNRRS